MPMTELEISRPRRWLDRVAFVISALSSPFLVTGVTVVLVVLLLRPTVAQLVLWMALAGFFSAVLPFLAVWALWRARRVTDMHVALREQRAIPFVATLGSGAIGVVLLYLSGAPPQLVALGILYLVVGLMLALISLRWKISVHSAVFTASILALFLVGYSGAIYVLLALPAVVWARVYRDRHTRLQGLIALLLTGLLTPFIYHLAFSLLTSQ